MENINDEKLYKTVLKSAGLGVILTLLIIAVFALIIKVAYLNTTVIKVVNQFIKVLSVFLGCFFNIRQDKGLLKGVLSGILYALSINLIFAIISTDFSFSLSKILDVLLMGIVGGISGILSVNCKR